MDGLSIAANVIAVVDISVKVITACSQYSKAVANAGTEISRFEAQVKGLKTNLEGASDLIQGPEGTSLPTSSALKSNLLECKSMLQKLLDKLEDGVQKSRRRRWLRALKWPFTSQETEAAISTLDKYHRLIMDGLQVDQTSLLLYIKNGVDSLDLNANTTPANKPYFNVPFPQDRGFISRPNIEAQIYEQLNSATGRAALIGMGGFGKSQIAINIAHEFHLSRPDMSVFWVYAASRATFEESYRSVAEKVALPHRHDQDVNILALVRDWLQREDIAPWLLILDNADIFDVLFDQKEEFLLASYLPKRNDGKILITSRNLNVAERLTGSNRKANISLPAMKNEEALLLLQDKIGTDYEKSAATNLVTCLDYIPLAVSQAAAYINRRRISIDTYMDRFKESEKKRTILLKHDGGDLRRHEQVSNSVVAAWQLTFDRLRQENPSAARLLSLLSCFQSQNIPGDILSGYKEVDGPDTDQDSDEEQLEEDMDALFAYSLISEASDPGVFEMHSLVQVCTRAWLSEADDTRYWDGLFLELVSKRFPNGEFETWNDCQMLLSHAERLLQTQPDGDKHVLDWSLLLTGVSIYMNNKGNYKVATALAEKSVEVRKLLLGPENVSTLTSMGNLANSYRNQGQWGRAETLQMEVIEARKKVLGDDHTDTLDSLADLALIYMYQEQWEKARDLLILVIKRSEETLGATHLDTISSLANLAMVRSNQDAHDEAEKILLQVIEIRREQLGEDHLETLTAMANLALTYSAQTLWDKAEALEVQVGRIRRIKLGEEHPSTLNSMTNLAIVYTNQGRRAEAEALETRVMEIRKAKYNADDPNALNNMVNLATTYHVQGRFEEAEKLLTQAIESCKRIYSPDHGILLAGMEYLAMTYAGLARWEEAEKLIASVFEAQKTKVGPDHLNTLVSMHSWGYILHGCGRLEEAYRLVDQCTSSCLRILGPEHQQTISAVEWREFLEEKVNSTA